jgi:predicted transcriptional regulator
MSEQVNCKNNKINDDINDEPQQNQDKSSNFIELEKQFNEIKDFLGNILQTGTKKIKDSFTNRNKKKITIDDLDIGSHPVIIEKFNTVETNINEIKDRLFHIETQISQLIKNNTANEELYQRRYENTTEMISDNYYNTNKKFDLNANTMENMKTNIHKINKILEIINEQKIDPIESRVDNIETSIYEIKNGVDYVIENIDPKQILRNTNAINKLLENHTKIALDIVSIKDDNKSLDEKIEEHKSIIQSSIIMID